MDSVAELGRNPVSKHQIRPEYGDEQADAGRDYGTAEPVSRDQILRRERGQGNINFPCSTDHEQDWQPYPVDPYSCYMCNHTYIQVQRVRRVPTGICGIPNPPLDNEVKTAWVFVRQVACARAGPRPENGNQIEGNSNATGADEG